MQGGKKDRKVQTQDNKNQSITVSIFNLIGNWGQCQQSNISPHVHQRHPRKNEKWKSKKEPTQPITLYIHTLFGMKRIVFFFFLKIEQNDFMFYDKKSAHEILTKNPSYLFN